MKVRHVPMNKKLVLSVLSSLIVAVVLSGASSLSNNFVYADCSLPGDSHGDNNPSEKKGEKMLNSGASVCEIAKACDAMKIEIDIENKGELHDTVMYTSADDHVQEKLDHAIEEGHGADGLYCYEVEDIYN